MAKRYAVKVSGKFEESFFLMGSQVLLLLFFVVFGKKMYLKNPEHLANRVEVGGLFWHFVDLIWIFLFPIMYLL